jgi:hypothetical protein
MLLTACEQWIPLMALKHLLGAVACAASLHCDDTPCLPAVPGHLVCLQETHTCPEDKTLLFTKQVVNAAHYLVGHVAAALLGHCYLYTSSNSL